MKNLAFALLAAFLLFGCQQPSPRDNSGDNLRDNAQSGPPSATDPVRHAIDALYGNVQTHTLANGLRIYLKPVPGSPVVTTKVVYRVGAADEDLNHTGLAHYLEHLMFKGTDLLMPGDIDRLTQRNGGANNAYTDHDITAYHFDFAADQWPIALKIEADRMRNLRIDERHEFELEKGAVIEELRMNEDQPWDIEYKRILPILFADGPYGHPIIGEARHVREATAQVITDFYNQWYQPNNAVIVMVGGFDPQVALKTIRELFEPIPSAKLPPRREAKVVTRNEPAREQVTSKFAQPRLLMGFNGVRLGEPDDFVLDVISQILTGGKTSRLYRKLIEEMEIASDTSSRNMAGRHPGWLAIDVELLPGRSLAEAEAVVVAELERLAREPVGVAELARARRQMAAGMIFYYEDIHELADAIAFGAAADQPDYYGKYLERIMLVTAADVQRVAGTLLNPNKRAVVTSDPDAAALDRGQETRDREQGTADRRQVAARRHKSPASVHRSHRATPLNPSRVPDAARHQSFDLARAERHVLPNGLTLLLLENHRLPIFLAAADVNHTRLLQPADKLGIATLTGRLLSEGAGNRTGEQIATQIGDLGGALSMHGTGGEIKVLSPDRRIALDIFLDCLMRPTFANDAFTREKARLLADVEDDEFDADAMAMQAFRQMTYTSHPFARPPLGTVASVTALKREDCAAFHAMAFVPGNTVLTLVGDFDSQQVLEQVRSLTANWKDKPVVLPAHDDPPLPANVEQRIISMPDSAQLQVLIGHVGIRRNHPDYYKLLVLDNVLGTGPGFTSRLSARLRDRQGLAYSVGGSIASGAGQEPGVFMCYIGTDAGNFKKVRDQIIEEITTLRDQPPTQQEVDDAKAYLLGSMPFGMTTTHGSAVMLLDIERHQLGATYLADYRAAIEAVTPADVQAMAKKHLHPDKLIIVAAGALGQDGEPSE